MTAAEIQLAIVTGCSLFSTGLLSTYIWTQRQTIKDMKQFMDFFKIDALKEYHDERERIKLLRVEAEIARVKRDIVEISRPIIEPLLRDAADKIKADVSEKFDELVWTAYEIALTVDKAEREEFVKEYFPVNATILIDALRKQNEL